MLHFLPYDRKALEEKLDCLKKEEKKGGWGGRVVLYRKKMCVDKPHPISPVWIQFWERGGGDNET